MIQNGFYISLRKTEVVDVNAEVHELPPDNGPFEEFAVADYKGCPAEWSKDGIFVKVEEGQPLWFDFRGNGECAVLCAVQRLNPVTNEPADLEGGLKKDPKQNYLKLPEQRWIDGYTNDGKVYQFMVTKAGEGLAVNEFLLPQHMRDSHAIGFAFYPPKVERRPKASSLSGMSAMNFGMPKIGTQGAKQKFTQNRVADNWNCALPPDGFCSTGGLESLGGTLSSKSPLRNASAAPGASAGGAESAEIYHMDTVEADIGSVDVVDILEEKENESFDKASMGQGGRIGQEIVQDNNTVDYYQEKPAGILTVYLALPDQFEAIMKKGKVQDATKPDEYVHSGKIGGVQVPLITKNQ